MSFHVDLILSLCENRKQAFVFRSGLFAQGTGLYILSANQEYY